MTTEEEIKLIAEFMGYKFAGDGVTKHYNISRPGALTWYYGNWELESFNVHLKEEFKYESSWDALMPVYIKCREIFYRLYNGDKKDNEMKAGFEDVKDGILSGNCRFAFEAIFDFIEWYNLNKEK